eukprot:gene11097-17073_t
MMEARHASAASPLRGARGVAARRAELLPVPSQPAYGAYAPGDKVNPGVIMKLYGGAKGGKTDSSRGAAFAAAAAQRGASAEFLTEQDPFASAAGVAAFEQAQFKQSDVDIFQKTFGLPSVKVQ